jgi:hypothetical protein
MSKYSFLLTSKEPEYHQLNERLRLKKIGGWLVAEAIEQEEISKLQSQATIKAVQLAKKIAEAKKIKLDEAFDLLQSGGNLSEMELLTDFTEETMEMIASGSSVQGINARLVTSFMRCRGEGFIDNEWVKLSDWTSEDTHSMTQDELADAIEFITAEQMAEVEAKAKKAKSKAGPELND